MRPAAIGVACVAVIAAVWVGTNAVQKATARTPGAGSSTTAATGQLKAWIAALPQRSIAAPPTMRLADGLVPPTNRWFSGLVFGPTPQPVFPRPLSVALSPVGFEVGVPKVTASAATIFGAHRAQVAVDVGAASSLVDGYDALSVSVAFHDASGGLLGRLRIAEGSPFASYTAAAAQTVRIGVPFAAAQGGLWTTTLDGREWALAVPSGEVRPAGNGTEVSLPAGASLTVFPVPDGGRATDLAAAAADPVTGTTVEHSRSGETERTTFRFSTAHGATPVVVAMPHHAVVGASCDLGTYPSIDGTLRVCATGDLTVEAPAIEAPTSLDLSRVSAADRATLITQVRADAAATTFDAPDSYFGGKQAYRAANLLQLARTLGVQDVTTDLTARLTELLRTWFTPAGCDQRATRCFVYDPAVRGIVGRQEAFGSEQFNDHHFHYGYWLYAAGVLAERDAPLAAELAPVADLLAADIAGDGAGGLLPATRGFDSYAGHSWASGFSPFADGNNQESSSEAVTAWAGVTLWAQARGDAVLRDRATWMLSLEAASARAYWTDTPLDSPGLAGYQHRIVSLEWGGKRDYATFFSADPNAILGIQLIPMAPVATYLGGDPARIRANVAEATPHGFDVQFGDYLVMYLALADPAAALADLGQVSDRSIDGANSRAYLTAWLLSRASAA